MVIWHPPTHVSQPYVHPVGFVSSVRKPRSDRQLGSHHICLTYTRPALSLILFQALGALLRHLRIGSASGRQHNIRPASGKNESKTQPGAAPSEAPHLSTFNPRNRAIVLAAKLVSTPWFPEQSRYLWTTGGRIRVLRRFGPPC